MIKITTDKGNKNKSEIKVKETDQQILDFITIDSIKFEQQQYQDQDISIFLWLQ